jgi:hypothetical protein
VIEHKVIDIRATGVMPGVVGEEIQSALNDASKDGWQLQVIQPVIYNSATTGYLLLILQREVADE